MMNQNKNVKIYLNNWVLKKIYHDYEESIVAKLRKQIDQIDESRGLKKDVLTAFLGKSL